MPPRKSLLVVDDSQSHAFFAERAFRKTQPGALIIPVASGEAALAHLEECLGSRPLPDLVLLDRHMPGGMDGFETLEAMRSRQHLDSVPVLMVTGSDDREHVTRARAAGADGFVVKPVEQPGYLEFAAQVSLWTPAESWRASKEIVRSSCVPAAFPVQHVDSAAMVMVQTPRSADQKLVELTAACEFAGITVRRALALHQTDKIIDAKRRLVVRYLMALPLPWSDLEVGDFFAFGKRYLQERRAENARKPLIVCGPRALALE